MAHDFSQIRFTIVLRVTEDEAINVDPSGRAVFLQLWFGFRLFHDNPTPIYRITLTGPRAGDDHLWNIENTTNVAIIGTKTYRHLTRSNRLHRVHADTAIHQHDGINWFHFSPCYIQVTGYNTSRSYAGNYNDQGFNMYANIDELQHSEFYLLVDIGPSLTQNCQVFLETYMDFMHEVINDDCTDLDN